jgi:serine phosphatase RsbU (regulator of sigma subunit)
LVLYTDGLYDVEGPHQDRIHQDWLAAQVQQRAGEPAGDLLDNLLGDIKTVSENANFADDVCLVAMEIAGLAKQG